MRVKELFIYPIKGLAGISKQQILAKETGFEWDRKLMLIDDQNKFVTQRNNAQLCLFKTSFEGEILKVDYQGNHCKVDLSQMESTEHPAEIWEHHIKVNRVSLDLDTWFSDQLHQSVRLVQISANFTRIKEVKTLNKKVPMSLADGYPFLILGTASMAQLNNTLTCPVSADRFRANIIVETTTAHEEDNYKNFSIGEAKLEVAKPCARCQVIGINQQTAERSKEVIASLSNYRKADNKIFFGANLICNQEGMISIGDQLTLAH